MRTQLNKRILQVFLLAGLALKGLSQQIPDSLLHYLEIATKNNPVILQKFYEYQAALQKVPQVGGLPDPELSAGVFLKPMELVNGNQIADLRLMQMFPWFGVIRSARDEMSLMANAKFELFRDAKLQVYYDVQSTWYELYKIQRNINITGKNIEILRTIERMALVKFQAASSPGKGSSSTNTTRTLTSSQSLSTGSLSGMQGMASSQVTPANSGSIQPSQIMESGNMGNSSSNSGLADLYMIQIETGELQYNLAALKNQYITLTARFNSYLNRSPVSPVFVSETIPLDTLAMSLSSVSDSIAANNPMLSMLEFEKQSIDARKNMVRSMGYPMVGLGLNYSFISKSEMSTSSMNGKDMIMPMVSVTLPVYRKKYNAMINEAELLRTAAVNSYNAAASNLQTEYYKAVQQYHDAQQRVFLYDNQYQLASKSLDLMIKDFASSSSTLTDLLRVRRQALDYELKQTEARADLNTASALLKRLMAYSKINQ